jgi:hypothetical protein
MAAAAAWSWGRKTILSRVAGSTTTETILYSWMSTELALWKKRVWRRST